MTWAEIAEDLTKTTPGSPRALELGAAFMTRLGFDASGRDDASVSTSPEKLIDVVKTRFPQASFTLGASFREAHGEIQLIPGRLGAIARVAHGGLGGAAHALLIAACRQMEKHRYG